MNLLDDARQYLSVQFKQDMSDLPEDSVRGCIEKLYSGGWVAYSQDYARFHATQREVLREVMSPIKRKAYVENLTGKRIKEYDEIISVDKADLEVKILVKRAIVEYGARRDKVTGERVELWVFRRESTDHMWPKAQYIEVETVAQAGFVKFGSINTPEREADKREQVETCYRPGTDKTPLQGWVARAEISWEQAHANEGFQSPIKKGGK